METKRFSQFGTFSVIVLSLIILFLVCAFIHEGFEDIQLWIGVPFLVLLIFALLTFCKLDIEIDRVHVSFSLGIGVIQKQYKLADLKNCESVTNSIFDGIGIRKISKGWLYNVSGRKAIELTFKNSDKVIRIGTNQPDKIVEIIHELIQREDEPVDSIAKESSLL